MKEISYSDDRRSRRRGEERQRKKSSAGKIIRNLFLILLLLLLFATAGLYIAGIMYYKDKFFRNTSVNGFDVSERMVSDVEDQIAARIAAYKLDIRERGDVVETITSDMIDYHYVSSGEVQSFLDSQKRYEWPLYYFGEYLGKAQEFVFESSAQYDSDLLNQTMDSLNCFQEDKVTRPEDAYITYLDGNYQVAVEVEGNLLKREKAQQLIRDAVDHDLNEVALEGQDCYEVPKKRQDDPVLNQTCEKLNTCLKTDLVYCFGDNRVALNAEVIRPWLSFDEEGTVTVDEASVRAFIQDMADHYDTLGKPREFTTHDGRIVTVDGCDYGWQMDQDATFDYMMDAIRAGNTGETYCEYIQTACSWYNSDLGDSYIEIDLGSQHVWLYIDGIEIVSTDCVSGLASDPARMTPEGTYTLYYKESPSVLKGENNEYESKVTYWMPFNDGIGLHDASWRSSFGGSIYQTDGSHGCINLPLNAAKEIYENVYDGIPIICYY